MNLLDFVLDLGEPEQRPLLLSGLGLLAALVAARVMEGDPIQSLLAVGVILAVPLLALRLGGTPGVMLAVGAAVGTWIAFRPWHGTEPAELPVVLAHRLAWFALPPLVAKLVLRDEDRDRLRVGPVHLYAPAVIMGIAVFFHLLVRRGETFTGGEREIQIAALLYGACYVVLVVLSLYSRVQRAGSRVPSPAATDRAVDLEDTGRFGMAARVYEREGQVDKAAEAAERAGEWERAARLYKRAGNDFNAGEMFARAGLWDDALVAYERARAFSAAARVCVRLEKVDRAFDLFTQAGDLPAGVRALEEAGRIPTPEQYRKAGQLDRATAVLEKRGEFLRAAEMCEQELNDPKRAAALYQKAGAPLQAGRILEASGRHEEALALYAAAPGGLMPAARAAIALGRTRQASELIAKVPSAEIDALEDDATLTLVARVMVEDGRHEQAVRILQGIKRRGEADGTVRLLLLGRALLQKGLGDLALEELRIAVSLPLDPADETKATYTLACLLEETGQGEEALPLYRKILAQDVTFEDVEVRYRRLKDFLTAKQT